MVPQKRLNDGIMVMGLPGTGKTSFLCSTCFLIQRGGLTSDNYEVQQSADDRIDSLAGMPVIAAGKFLNDLFNDKEGEYWQPTDPYALPRILHLCRVRAKRTALKFDVWTVDMPGETWRMLSGQRDADDNLDDQRRDQLRQIRQELLPRTSAFVLLVDATAEESSAFWQSSWFEDIHQQTPHLHNVDVPVPISFVLTKVDLLLSDDGFRVNLAEADSRYYAFLKQNDLLADRDVRKEGGRVSYSVRKEWFIETSQAVDADEAEAIAWDLFRQRAPSSFEAVVKLSEDPRFEVGVHAVSAWGQSLPTAESGVDLVPELDFIRPARVLDPVVRMLDNLVFRRRTSNRLRFERWVATGLAALFLLGPIAYHGSIAWAKAAYDRTNAVSGFRALRLSDFNPYRLVVDKVYPQGAYEREELKLDTAIRLAEEGRIAEALYLVSGIVAAENDIFARRKAEVSVAVQRTACAARRTDQVMESTLDLFSNSWVKDVELALALGRAYRLLSQVGSSAVTQLLDSSEVEQVWGHRSDYPATGREIARSRALLLESKLNDKSADSIPEKEEFERVLAQVQEVAGFSGDPQLMARIRNERLALARDIVLIERGSIVFEGTQGTQQGTSSLESGIDKILALGKKFPELEVVLQETRQNSTDQIERACYQLLDEKDFERLIHVANSLESARSKFRMPSRDAEVLRTAAALLEVERGVRSGSIEEPRERLVGLINNVSLWQNPSPEDASEIRARDAVNSLLGEIADVAASARRSLVPTSETVFDDGLHLLEIQKLALRQANLPPLSEIEEALVRSEILLRKIKFRADQPSGDSGAAIDELREIWIGRETKAALMGPEEYSLFISQEEALIEASHFDAAKQVLALRRDHRIGFEPGLSGEQRYHVSRSRYLIAEAKSSSSANPTLSQLRVNEALEYWGQAPEIPNEVLTALIRFLSPGEIPEGLSEVVGYDWGWAYLTGILDSPGVLRLAADRVEDLSLVVNATTDSEAKFNRFVEMVRLAASWRAQLKPTVALSMWQSASDITEIRFQEDHEAKSVLLEPIGTIIAEASQIPAGDRRKLLHVTIAAVEQELQARRIEESQSLFELAGVHARVLRLDQDPITQRFMIRLERYLHGLDQMVFVAQTQNADGGFFMAPYETTVAEYQEFLVNPIRLADVRSANPGIQLPPSKSSFMPMGWGGQSGNPALPVTGIDFVDALAYATWSESRLPTVAEWKLAAYGTSRLYPWGSGESADTVNSSGAKPAQEVAGTRDKTPDGIFFMGGNVLEWAWTDQNELRRMQARHMGSSWNHGSSRARSMSAGHMMSIEYRSAELGMRIVKDAMPRFLRDWARQNK